MKKTRGYITMENEENLTPDENPNEEINVKNVSEDIADDDFEEEDFEEESEDEDFEESEDSDDKTEEEEYIEEDNGKIRIMIVTEDNIISGDLQVPEEIQDSESTKEQILFNTLNCGNQFIALANSSIMDKDNTEFEPERVKFFVVNTAIIQNCRIVPTHRRKHR